MVQQFSCISSTICSLKLSKTPPASRKNNTFIYLLRPLKILYQRIVRRQRGRGLCCSGRGLEFYTELLRMNCPGQNETSSPREENSLCSFGWWNSLGGHRFQSSLCVWGSCPPWNKWFLLPICSLLDLSDLVIKLYVTINRLVTVQTPNVIIWGSIFLQIYLN